MRLAVLAVLLAVNLLSSNPAFAAKKQLVMVLGGLDNPFFQDIAAGCKQWTKDHADSDYQCVAVGPKTSARAADEVKLLSDAIAKGASAVAVVPATGGLAEVLKGAGAIPVMAVAGDFPEADRAVRKTLLSSDDFQIGAAIAGLVSKFKPAGGTICFEQNNPDAGNINARATGLRETLAAKPGVTVLAGENGWTEVAGCPLYNNDDVATANKQLAGLLKDNPKIDAVVLAGGWAMFDAKGFAKTMKPVKARLKDNSLVVVSADTLPPQMDALKAGLVQGLVGQLPFSMGNMAPDIMIQLINGEDVPPMVAAGVATCTDETVKTCIPH